MFYNMQVSIERLDDPYAKCIDSSKATGAQNVYSGITSIPVEYTVKVKKSLKSRIIIYLSYNINNL